MSRILLLNQYYAPDTAATGVHATAIAERLALEGHAVKVITGQPSYASDARDVAACEERGGVRVRRIGVGRLRGRERMSTRIIGYACYLVGAAAAAMRTNPDVVISFHTPPPLPLIGLAVARRRHASLIYIPQDIHPDVLLASGFLRLPGPVVAGWDAVNRAILSRSDRVIALGEGMRATLIEKGAAPERSLTISLWAEPELGPRPRDTPLRTELGVGPSTLAVLYAGNLGVMHPVEPVLGAAKILAQEDIVFIFAGAGVRREHWRARARELGLDNVTFLGYQHGEAFARLVAAADVALVCLDRGMERLAVPSRSFAFLAAGKPLIAVMAPEADIASIVTAAGAGWQTWETDELITLLRGLRREPERLRLAGQRARTVFEQHFTRAVVTARYARLVASLHGLAPEPAPGE